ncbi:MAG: AT hook motif protein [Deltaproteobacteria bacterium RIFCSPLOWO2_12_FULL_40_28]|nr:MAG: AT hook motif protein [Deltaproteobacteria bacterium RIFCSPLOWO2_02_FULL_40_36]OGQ55182.1 MAG: AT hook motif protein [Deltaproteobacteria bacterium RIFCSPLOWO2_12_FULL_40_28]
MKSTKDFPFEKARRITAKEVALARKAIEHITGKKRKLRGRPPKSSIEKYKAISIRLHPRVIEWAKREAKKKGIGYQTIISQVLLKKVA